MKHALLVGLLVFGMPCTLAWGQDQTHELEVIKVVERLFDAMRAGDSAMARSVFHAEARLIGTTARDGSPEVRLMPMDRFIQAIGSPHEAVWDEQLWDAEVRVDGALATVWTKYAFYLGERFSHCGVDSFQLVHLADGWKIVSLADTRRTEGCDDRPRR